MSDAYAANAVVVTINSVVYQGVLTSHGNRPGDEPAEAVVVLTGQDPYTATVATFQGKTASITVDATTLITGHVVAVIPEMEARRLSVKIWDKRYLINKDWVGRRHLGASGLRVLGADVIFNKDGQPNKDVETGIYLGPPVDPAFVYEKGNVTDPEDCAEVEGAYWTVGDAFAWVWNEYVDDVTIPTIPSDGGLDQAIDPVPLFGKTVGKALSEILARAEAIWGLDPDGTAYVATRATPNGTRTIKFKDPDAPSSAATHDLDHPVVYSVANSIEEAVSHVEVVGGHELRECTFLAADFDTPVQAKIVQPAPTPPPVTVVPVGFTMIRNWYNYQRREVWRHRLKHSAYSGKGAGGDMRAKDKAKPLLSELLMARDRDGNYVDAESECAFSAVGAEEFQAAQYWGGVTLDPERSEVLADKYQAVDAEDSPERLTVVVETERRQYDTANVANAALPTDIHRAVIRDDFVHKTRAAGTKLIVPVDIEAIYTAAGKTWTVTEQIDLTALLAAGATRDYTLTFTGGLGGPEPPWPAPTLNMPAGVAEDALGPLAEIVSGIENMLGRNNTNGSGAFPSFVGMTCGEKITTSPANKYGSTGEEVVVGTAFNDRNQRFEFVVSNQIGPAALDLAERFVNRRRYRTAL